MAYGIRATPEVEIDGKLAHCNGVPSKEKCTTRLALGTDVDGAAPAGQAAGVRISAYAGPSPAFRVSQGH